MLLFPAETFFVTRIWNICSYLCVSFGVYLHSICIYVLSHQYIGHGVLKEKAFWVYLKKSINLSCLSLETSANLVMSRAIYPYLATRSRCKTRHMGRSKCNRSFHSQDVSQPQIGGSFWNKKKKLCTCKPYKGGRIFFCVSHLPLRPPLGSRRGKKKKKFVKQSRRPTHFHSAQQKKTMISISDRK